LLWDFPLLRLFGCKPEFRMLEEKARCDPWQI
jgi:hypothetical protein